MSVRTTLVLLIALGLSCSCTPVATPTPVPSPTVRPSPTLDLPAPSGLLPTPTNDRLAPASVPACQGAIYLEQPIKFTWAGIDDILQDAPAKNWTYYHCVQNPEMLAASYRQWMVKDPYAWMETYWEERPDATLGAYFSARLDQWLYVWFLSDPGDLRASNLVAAWWNVKRSC